VSIFPEKKKSYTPLFNPNHNSIKAFGTIHANIFAWFLQDSHCYSNEFTPKSWKLEFAPETTKKYLVSL